MRDKDEGKSEDEQIDGAAKNKVEEMINDPDLEAKKGQRESSNNKPLIPCSLVPL